MSAARHARLVTAVIEAARIWRKLRDKVDASHAMRLGGKHLADYSTACEILKRAVAMLEHFEQEHEVS